MSYKSNELFDREGCFTFGTKGIYQHFFQWFGSLLFSQSNMDSEGCIEDPVSHPIRWVGIVKMIELEPEIRTFENMEIDCILTHDPQV